VDPNTVPSDDTAHDDGECTEVERDFVDDNLPAYEVLGVGEQPGDAQAPLGWTLEGRDIDRTPSEGPLSSIVRLGDLGDAAPSCVAVRAVSYPGL
jgi:hypothetical protein